MSRQAGDKSQFKACVASWAGRLDIEVKAMAARPMKTRWASYSTAGRLTFDESLLGLPRKLQDYIIVHE
jgi:predicted metal-dependent hydrolase